MRKWDPLNQDKWHTRSGVTRIVCGSIAEFMTVHTAYFSSQRNLIYRGHANYRWRLESSLTRVLRSRITSSGEEATRQRIIADTTFPTAFSEFLSRLYELGDKESRDLIREYHDLWNKSENATPMEELKGMITGNELTPELLQTRSRLRQTEFQLLAIAQHYGMPTPLLDWSRSPYVAWYFALREPQTRFPTLVAIAPSYWRSLSRTWLERSAEELRDKVDEAAIRFYEQYADRSMVPPFLAERRAEMLQRHDIREIPEYASFLHFPAWSHLNDRLQAQQGTLTKHSVAFSLEKIASILNTVRTSEDRPLIWKFVLATERPQHELLQLRLMNITGSTLSPGLVGAGQLGLDSLRFESYSAKHGWPHHFGSA